MLTLTIEFFKIHVSFLFHFIIFCLYDAYVFSCSGENPQYHHVYLECVLISFTHTLLVYISAKVFGQ